MVTKQRYHNRLIAWYIVIVMAWIVLAVNGFDMRLFLFDVGITLGTYMTLPNKGDF